MKVVDIYPRPYVSGQWVSDEDLCGDSYIVDFDPSTGEELLRLQSPRVELAEKIMRAAYDAGKIWCELNIEERKQALKRLAEAIKKRHSAFVAAIQAEAGILQERANEEVTHGVELLKETANIKFNLDEIISQGTLPDAEVTSIPYGVVVWIMSWNSPLAALCKIGGPLLVGNAVVLKVSQFTPICSYLFSQAVDEANFPPGVVNIAWDKQGEIAAALVASPLLGKCAFTGKLSNAKNILRNISDNHLRPTFFETGGGGIQIVMADADIKLSLPHIFWGALTLGGQICCAGTRVLVHESLVEKLVSELAGQMLSLHVGSAHNNLTNLGPLISGDEVDRLMQLLNQAKSQGVTIYEAEVEIPGSGFFMRPALVLTEDCNNVLYENEIFGPIVVVTPFKDTNQLLEMLQVIPAGLAMSIYTEDPTWFKSKKNKFNVGTIWLNGHYQSTVRVPFGGNKDSGYGRERGVAGLREFTQIKTVIAN